MSREESQAASWRPPNADRGMMCCNGLSRWAELQQDRSVESTKRMDKLLYNVAVTGGFAKGTADGFKR